MNITIELTETEVIEIMTALRSRINYVSRLEFAEQFSEEVAKAVLSNCDSAHKKLLDESIKMQKYMVALANPSL